jgi:hypothetical protein
MGTWDQESLRCELEDLLGLESGLTDWEVEFIESLSRWEGDFTDRQAAALERTWNKYFGLQF